MQANITIGYPQIILKLCRWQMIPQWKVISIIQPIQQTALRAIFLKKVINILSIHKALMVTTTTMRSNIRLAILLLQQYLIAFPGGRLQVTRQCWDVKKKKWFHQYAGQKIPAHDWLHWTGNAQNWNTMCAACHSTNLQKNYDYNNNTYHTTYQLMTVSCESCHGAGRNAYRLYKKRSL